VAKTHSLFVPGRLCLFGEHSDWAGLQRVINIDAVPVTSIVTGIEQGIYADIDRDGLARPVILILLEQLYDI